MHICVQLLPDIDYSSLRVHFKEIVLVAISNCVVEPGVCVCVCVWGYVCVCVSSVVVEVMALLLAGCTLSVHRVSECPATCTCGSMAYTCTHDGCTCRTDARLCMHHQINCDNLEELTAHDDIMH